LKSWSKNERRAFENIAPVVAATRPANWPGDAKASMRRLLRAKGGLLEAAYARLLGEHEHFRSVLRAICKRTDG